MSDGKSFLKSQEMSYSERLAELERKLPIFIDRLQQYDKLFDEIKKIKDDLLFVDKVNEQTVLDLQKQKNEQQHQIDNITVKHSSVCKIIDNIISSNSKAKSEVDLKHKSLEENQIAHMNYIDSVKRSISEMHSKFVSKQELDEHKNLQDRVNKSLRTDLDRQSVNIQNFNTQMEFCAQKIYNAERNALNEIAPFKDALQDLRDNMANDHVIIKKLDENTIPLIKREITLAIDFLKKELSQNSVNPNTIKEDIQKKLDLIELDGKNAVLRATNNEKLVEMMKKQIENIYLLLKKHELSQ